MEIIENSEKGIFSDLPQCKLKQNRYVQKVNTSWLVTYVPMSRRMFEFFRWKTLNVKKEVPNVMPTWKNQGRFMMEPYHFFLDCRQTHKIPIIWTKVKKPTTGNIIFEPKNLIIDKSQGISNYPADTSPDKSIYSQGKTKSCVLANAVILERIDYFSGLTSIFQGAWDAYAEEMILDHTQYDFNCPLLAIPAMETEKDDINSVARPCYMPRSAPYPHKRTCYNPTFTTRDNLQKKYLRNDYLKRKLIEMYTSSNYNLYPIPRIGKKNQVPYYDLPTVQPFVSNKTLKHIFYKFPHKSAGSGRFITGTIYYKIRYKVLFSCYFKTEHVQGTEGQTFTSGGKKCNISNILKELGGGFVKMETKLDNPSCFHDAEVDDHHFRLFHPLTGTMYS